MKFKKIKNFKPPRKRLTIDKFKIGDEVEIQSDVYHEIHIGDIFEIRQIGDENESSRIYIDYMYDDNQGDNYYYYPHELYKI